MWTKVSRLDRLLWKLFFWRWNDILLNDPAMAKKMGMHILKFAMKDDQNGKDKS